MLSTFHNARKKRLDGEQGFTLIELLVVVVILGILIAIAIPVYLNYKKSANDKAAQSDLRNSISVLEVCNSDGSYPGAMDANGSFTGSVPCGTSNVSKLNLSANTTVRYSPDSASTPTSYTLVSTNSAGTPKIYCYNSTKGGPVSEVKTSGATLANATC